MMKTLSNIAPIPNPTPVLFLLAGTMAWCLVWVEDPGSPWLLLVLVPVACVLVPASISILVARPSFAMSVLIVAAAMPRLFVQISGLKARPEHLACGLLLLALPFWLRKRSEPMKWFAPDFILAAYAGVHLFSSLVMSVDPAQTAKWASEQIIVVMAYLILRVLVADRASFLQAFNIALVVGTVEAGFAIFCFYSNLLFGTELGMELDQYGTTPGTYGTQYEANILGSYCGACCAVLLMMYLRQRKRRFLVGFAVTFAAMAISLSRGALLGSMVALLVIAYYNRKFIDRESSGRLALAMVAIALTVAPAVLGLWSERFSSVEISDISADVTTRDRVVTLGLAYEGISEHPLLGGGTSSYQLEFGGDEFGQPGEAAWIANTEMRVLYDTGVLGLGLFIAFFVSLVIGVKRLLKKAPNLELQALTMAFVVYLISFQFTEGTMLAFSWVHLGLIAAGIAVFRNAKGDTQNVVSGATVRPGTNN